MKLNSFFIRTFAVFVSMLFIGCSSEPITPEVIVSEGTVNYFSESMDFPSNGGSKILNFTSNVKWTLKVSETQSSSNWCTVSQAEGNAGTYNISVTVAENAGYDDRNVVLVLSAGELRKNVIVNQKQKNSLTLTTDRFEIGNEGGTIDVEVKSNVDFNVEIPDAYKSWISQTSMTRAISTKSHTFNIAESKEYDKREGEIIFSSGDITETVKVYQSGSAILILSQNEFTLGSEGGTISIDISSNFEYETDMPDVDWVKAADKVRAVSSHTLIFDVSPNTTHDNREAVIVFKDARSDKKESVTIKQKQKDAILLSSDKVEIPQDGATFSVDVNSNVDYTIEIPSSCSSWIDRTSAPSKAYVTRSLTKSTPYFRVSSSESYDKREGEIYFKYNDITETLKVYQSGGAILVLNQDSYHLEGKATSINVQLKSNIDYSVSISDDWITEVSSRAVSSSSKNFNIAVNRTGKTRKGKITFTSSDGSKTAVVTVTQETIVQATDLKLSFDKLAYIGESYTIYVTSTPSNAITDYEWSSSNTDILTVNGNGNNATIKMVGFGEADIIVKDKYSGITIKYPLKAWVSGFTWNSTGEIYWNYPLITIAIGESEKLSYTSDQGTNIPNLFGNLDNFVFYEPTYVVSKPSVISIDADGTVTGLKVGTVGIKPGKCIFAANNGDQRIYINVIKEYEESEYNDDFQHANTIKPNQKMKFSLRNSGDVDVFKFTRPTQSASQRFYVKLTYEGDFGSSSGTRILSYDLYNSSLSLFGTGNPSFDATGGEKRQSRWIDTTEGYIRFYMNDDYKTYLTPNGYFYVEFVPIE